MKTFTDLIQIPTFEERLEYLFIGGKIGIETFGSVRYLNQQFYSSAEWASLRKFVIARDAGCDLAFPGYEIYHGLYVHHIDPATPEMILDRDPKALDPENLITVSGLTHRRIHYGLRDERINQYEVVRRYPNDTSPWKRST